MSWNNSVYTTLGTAMLSEALAGKGMNFTRAVSGAGTMAAAELSNATAVTDQRQTLAIASIKETGEDEDATRTIKIQITNAGLAQGYVMHQIGIYAELVGSDSDALAVILQDERGIEIPSETENADFVMEFYAMLAISGAAQIAIAADPNVVATEKRVREMISEHDKDPNAHANVISAALSAAIKKLEDSGQIMDEAAAQKFVREMLDQYGAAKDISFDDTYKTGASNLQEALDNVLSTTLPKLTVTTVAGSSLTVTDGQSTITGTADSAGSFTATLPRHGRCRGRKVYADAALLCGYAYRDCCSRSGGYCCSAHRKGIYRNGRQQRQRYRAHQTERHLHGTGRKGGCQERYGKSGNHGKRRSLRRYCAFLCADPDCSRGKRLDRYLRRQYHDCYSYR